MTFDIKKEPEGLAKYYFGILINFARVAGSTREVFREVYA